MLVSTPSVREGGFSRGARLGVAKGATRPRGAQHAQIERKTVCLSTQILCVLPEPTDGFHAFSFVG